MKTPMFSIILPCKNAANTIVRSLQSVIEQDADWELVIVDGESTDGTLDVVYPYLNDTRIILDSRYDSGIYSAINRGITIAKGQYICILNADDAYLAGALTKVSLALQEKYDFCCAPVLWKNKNTETKILASPIPFDNWLKDGLQQMPCPHVGFFISSRCSRMIGNYREEFSIAADHEFLLNVAKHQLRGIFLNEPIAEILSGGLSNGYKAKWQSFQIAI